MARLTWRLSDEQLIRRLRFQQRWWRPFWTAMLILGLLLLAATFWIEPRLWSALSEPGMDFDKLEANAERLVEATPGKKHQVTASTYQEAFVWGMETGNQAALNFGNGALCLGVGYFFLRTCRRKLDLLDRCLERQTGEGCNTDAASESSPTAPEDTFKRAGVRRLLRLVRDKLQLQPLRELTDGQLRKRFDQFRRWPFQLLMLAGIAMVVFAAVFAAWKLSSLWGTVLEPVYCQALPPLPDKHDPADILALRWYEVLWMRTVAGFLEGVRDGFALGLCAFVGLLLTVGGFVSRLTAARRAELLRRCGILPDEAEPPPADDRL